MAKVQYSTKVREAAVEDFGKGLGLGTVARKYDVPKSAVRSFVRSAKLNTHGRADLPEKQHAPRPAEKLIVARAKAGDKARTIASSFRLPFRTAIGAAWRFGNVWPSGYNPLT